MKKPELLAPAGSRTMMLSAFHFGADAIYAGQPRYSLRVRNNEFGQRTLLADSIAEAQALGKAFYIVSNIFPHNAKLTTFIDDMAEMVAMHPNALIMSDPGLIDITREHWPDMPIHLSVQANTVNWASVRFWQKMGIQRVILSRELSLDEIEEIRQRCPEMELEVFVHGALCIAYSGRCLLSGYFNHRDANQGSCTNSCRWDYKMHQLVGASANSGGSAAGNSRAEVAVAPPVGMTAQKHEQDHGAAHGISSIDISEQDSDFFLEEGNRPGEMLPIDEDEHGTYIMNSRDLRAIEHVARLVRIGVDSLKIEGRTKSAYYVGRSTQAYRHAIDDALSGREFNPELIRDLEGLANRGYTDGFFQRHHDADYQNYLRGYSESSVGQYVGNVAAWDEQRHLQEITVKNRFSVGDTLEFIDPTGNFTHQISRMENAEAKPVQVAPGNGHRVWIELPRRLSPGGFATRLHQKPQAQLD